MKASEIAEIHRFLYNESCRLENLYITKWNNLYAHRRADVLDMVDVIELMIQSDYLNSLHQRLQILMDYMRE